MNQKRKTYLLFLTLLNLSILFVADAYANEKEHFKIKGKVVQKSDNQPVPGASVIIEQLNKGTSTDENGEYEIVNIPKGKYTIKFVCLTYKDLVIENTDLTKSPTASPLVIDAQMEEDFNLLNEVVVQSIKRENTELSAINAVRTSAVVMSAVSSNEMSKTPDKNAAEVVKRVPGISILDDRYIVIRGLPQRYNNVWLNNSSVPSSDPDTRSFSFDMIPTSQIENILIVKSPGADLPAEFSGGFLKIQSKSIPSKDNIDLQYSTGVNTSTGFKNFVSINKNNWNLKDITPIPDQKGAVQFNKVSNLKNGNVLGITASADYSYQYRIVDDMKNSRYGVYNRVEDKPEYLYDYTDNINTASSKLGALLNGTYMWGNNKILIRNLFNQSTVSKYTNREGWQDISSRYDQEKYEYLNSTRTIYTGQLAGEHILRKSVMSGGDDLIDWNVSYSFASKNDPDRRIINREQNTFVGDKYFGLMGIDQNEITKDWTKLEENIITAGANYKKLFNNPLKNTSKPIEFKVGAYYEYRTREYNAKNYAYRFDQSNLPDDFRYLDPVTEILTEKYLADNKLYLADDTDNRNSYKGKDMLEAFYAQVNFPMGKFRVNAGARLEARQMTLTSFTSIQGTNTKDRDYDQFNVFPSLNLAYDIKENQILRFAYGISTNRQEFREVSPSVYYDFNLFSDVKGNPDLKPAIVNNLDLKYEWYITAKEYISVALFYKHFKNPIEWTYLDAGGSYTYTFENANSANNYGVEIDIRKNLGFIGLSNFSVGFNASFIKSKVLFDKQSSLEKDRPMQGQSPYLINASLFYDVPAVGLQIGALYNRIGKRIVGIGRVDTSTESNINNDVPDTYEMPRDIIDFVVSKSIGKHVTLKFNAKDILAQKVVFAQFPRFYDSNSKIVERKQVSKQFNPGSSYSLSIQLTF